MPHAQSAQTSSARAAPSFSDGGMRLARRDAEVRFSEDRCQPASFVLLEGGQVDIIVHSGPPQSFLIGRDVEDVSTTPLIPAGDSYTWCAAAAASPLLCALLCRCRCACIACLRLDRPALPAGSRWNPDTM